MCIGKPFTMFGRLRSRLQSNHYLTLIVKLRVSPACVLSTLIHGSDAWTTYRQQPRLETFHLRCLLHLECFLSCNDQDVDVNFWLFILRGLIYWTCGPSPLFIHCVFYWIIRYNRLCWLGHLLRIIKGCLPKEILLGQLANATTPVGRPCLRYKDVLKRDLCFWNTALGLQMTVCVQTGETLWTVDKRIHCTSAWRGVVRTGSIVGNDRIAVIMGVERRILKFDIFLLNF